MSPLSRRASGSRGRAFLVVGVLPVVFAAFVPFAGCGDDAASPAATPAGGNAGTGGDSGLSGKGGSAGKDGGAGKAGATGGSSSDGGSAGDGGAAGDGGDAGSSGDGGTGGSGGSNAGAAGTAGMAGEAGQGGTASGGASAGSGGKAGSPSKFTFQSKYSIQSQFPEGGIYDHSAHVFYVGSLGDGGVRRIDATSGAETEIFKETAKGNWWTLGMDVDLVRRRLWVCAMDDRTKEQPPQKTRAGRVWLFDLKDNKRLADYPLAPAQSDGTCTDVSVADNGDAYIADRERGIVYRATADTPPAIFATDPLLKGNAVAGLNGISVLPDQSALLAIVYQPSRLVRIDLTTKKTTEVDIEGPFLDSATLLNGADGLALFKGNAYVAFTERFIQVVPTDATWKKGVATAIDDVPKGLTDVVATPNGLYLLNGQSVTFAFNAKPNDFELKLFDGVL